MHILIVGSGTMGSGIAQTAASVGHSVIIYDNNPEALITSEKKLISILDRLIEKEKIGPDEKKSILENIRYSSTLDNINNIELVIEAIVEDTEVKRKVFKDLEEQLSENCIIASNTSSLSITALASSLVRPERFIGLHFFNPAPLMALVEIIPALQTSNQTIELCRQWMSQWGKTGVLAKDTPGFIVNRIARPYYGEAIRIYEEGIADPATIDWAMEELGGFRMGPFKLMDFIGHDVNYAVSQSVFKAFYYDNRYKPSHAQKQLVEAGYLGRKTGRGFYYYNDNNDASAPNEDRVTGRTILERIVARIINEAADACYLKIASKEDIDLAMTKGVNYPRGPLQWADELGIENCVKLMDDLYNTYHESQYRCTVLLRKMAERKQRFYGASETVEMK